MISQDDGAGERFHWREHEGRGYWRGGAVVNGDRITLRAFSSSARVSVISEGRPGRAACFSSDAGAQQKRPLSSRLYFVRECRTRNLVARVAMIRAAGHRRFRPIHTTRKRPPNAGALEGATLRQQS